MSQINNNKYLGNIISSIGNLIFGVYLIHNNKCIKEDIINNLFNNEKNDISVSSVYRLFMTKSLLILIICIIIDYLRNCLFHFLKIRKNCIILEKKLFEILK